MEVQAKLASEIYYYKAGSASLYDGTLFDMMLFVMIE